MPSAEQNLWAAAESGRDDEVLSLISDNPGLDVNLADLFQFTALHWASCNGHAEVVKLLLAHPSIDVNIKDTEDYTPFSRCCFNGNVPVVRLLLQDPRVDVTLSDEEGRTPLWWASFNGNHEVIEWLITRGRDLGDLNQKLKNWEGKHCTALEIAKERNQTEATLLLERFMANPSQTRYEVRLKLGQLNDLAAEFFALIVFLCDDLLRLKLDDVPPHSAAVRYFAIASKLPMELQMVLCRRVVGSKKQNILHKDSEVAFKSLATNLLLVAKSQ